MDSGRVLRGVRSMDFGCSEGLIHGWSEASREVYIHAFWGGWLGVSTPNDAYVMTEIRHAVR
jgi:hypothetical protein